MVVEYEQFNRELLARPEFLATEENVLVYYNGVDLMRSVPRPKLDARTELRLRHDGLLVGTLSRVHPVKNLAMQIRAMTRLIEKGLDPELHILGRESTREERVLLDNLILESSLRSCVRLHGIVEDPAPFLAAFDVVTLSSLTEGVPNSLIEAMAMERPIVATDVGGVREITESRGAYVAIHDDYAFAEAIVAMSRKEFVKYPTLPRHDMEGCMSRWETILLDVLNSRKLRSLHLV